jgi:hypothetical protein
MNPSRVGFLILSMALTATVPLMAARAADTEPQEVLKSHGLKKSGSTYILASEADVQKKLNEARLASRQLNFALAQQDAALQGAQGRKALIEELTQERIALNEQLGLIGQQLDALGPPNGNIASTVQRNQLVTQHNQLVAALEILTDRINLIREQGSDPQLPQKMSAEVARRREAYLQTILDLRQIVDKTTALYGEMAQDDTLKGHAEARAFARIRR